MDELEKRVAALEQAHQSNRDRINQNKMGIKTALAALVFIAVVFGIPIASVKWSHKEFEFSRDTASPELVIIGGLVAASLFVEGNPVELLKSILNRK